MKRNRLTHVFVVVVCTIGVLGFGTVAKGALFTIFEDGLENVSPAANSAAWTGAGSGDWDPNNATVGRWTVKEVNSPAAQVSSFGGGSNSNVKGGYQPAAHTGSNYLIGGYHYNFWVPATWYRSGLPCAVFTIDAVNINLDFWVYQIAGTIPAGDYKMAIAGYKTVDANGDPDGEGAFLMKTDTDGILYYIHNRSWVSSGLTLTTSAWNHVVVDVNLAAVPDPLMNISVNGTSIPAPVPAWYAGDPTVGCVRFYSDYTEYYDDIKVTTVTETVPLTMATSPSLVTSVVPAVGSREYVVGATATVVASRFVGCPAVPDIYVFDHWTGPVADAYAATTTVLMDDAKSVTAVFVVNNVCGDECHQKQLSDLNGDCRVNFKDLGLLLTTWLDDVRP